HVGVAEGHPRIALVVADVVGAEVDHHRLRLDVEVPGRRRVGQRARVDHRHGAGGVAAVVLDHAAAGGGDGADLGVQGAGGDGFVGVPVALGLETAVARGREV